MFGGTTTASLSQRYFYGNGSQPTPLAQETPGDNSYLGPMRWLVTDDQGTWVEVADNNTGIQNAYFYDPYGNLLASLGPDTLPRFQFGGQEYDPESSLYHFDHRYYDPVRGRFLTQDPTGLGPDANPYRFAGNDPVDFTDPTGLSATPLGFAFGSGTGQADPIEFGRPAGLIPATPILVNLGDSSGAAARYTLNLPGPFSGALPAVGSLADDLSGRSQGRAQLGAEAAALAQRQAVRLAAATAAGKRVDEWWRVHQFDAVNPYEVQMTIAAADLRSEVRSQNVGFFADLQTQDELEEARNRTYDKIAGYALAGVMMTAGAVGSWAMIAEGAALAATSEAGLLARGLGVATALKGADNLQAIVRGTDSYTERMASHLPGGPVTGAIVSMGADLGLSLGTAAVLQQLNRNAAAVTQQSLYVLRASEPADPAWSSTYSSWSTPSRVPRTQMFGVGPVFAADNVLLGRAAISTGALTEVSEAELFANQQIVQHHVFPRAHETWYLDPNNVKPGFNIDDYTIDVTRAVHDNELHLGNSPDFKGGMWNYQMKTAASELRALSNGPLTHEQVLALGRRVLKLFNLDPSTPFSPYKR